MLTRLQRKVIEQQNNFENIYQEILVELAAKNVFIVNEKQLTSTQRIFVSEYFRNEIISNLFPVMIDDTKAFPYMKDKASYLYLKLESIDSQSQEQIRHHRNSIDNYFSFCYSTTAWKKALHHVSR